MISSSFVPIITHPERNQAILKREDILLDLLDQGALCQVTAMSLTGEFGKDCEWFACRMIEAGGVHFIASDAHSTGWRRPGFSPAVRVAEQIIGEIGARRLVKDYPEAVLSGGIIDPAPVKRLPKPRRFWFF
jgi:protein-tyrosine phosphatase